MGLHTVKLELVGMIYVRHCSSGHVCWFVQEFETDCDVTNVDVTSSCSVNQPSLHGRIFTKGLSTEQMQGLYPQPGSIFSHTDWSILDVHYVALQEKLSSLMWPVHRVIQL